MTLLLFSFAAGLATILAPCIWPLLPIVLTASSGEGRRRPLGLVLGLMTSFLILTLSVSYLEKALGIDPDAFRLAAVAVISLLGLSLIVPSLGSRFEVLVSRLLRPLQGTAQSSGQGFLAGFAGGFSIGLVWAPCAGPILATIATLAATRSVNARVILVAVAYVFGIGVPLFLLAMGSSRIFSRLREWGRYSGRIQQAFGLVMIAAALLIYTDYDKKLQLRVLDAFPSYGRLFARIEDNEHVRRQLDEIRKDGPGAQKASAREGSDLEDLGPAPEFTGISRWLNSPPLSLRKLRGKVVLVDFWTYSCINCLRTLPFVKHWHQAYGPSGLVVIGVHAPEFAFEKKTANVEAALRQFGVSYPVAQDNDFATWKAYDNHYWPAEYLIDAAGRVRLAHFGEGEAPEMDAAIRELLADAGRPRPSAATLPAERSSPDRITPETYLGRERMERFSSPKPELGKHLFALPRTIGKDHFALQGLWTISGASAISAAGSSLELQFQAEKVYLVIGPRHEGDSVAVLLDGRPISPEDSGADVQGGRARLDGHRLYHLVDLRGKSGPHRLRLVFDERTSVYAFTFG